MAILYSGNFNLTILTKAGIIAPHPRKEVSMGENEESVYFSKSVKHHVSREIVARHGNGPFAVVKNAGGCSGLFTTINTPLGEKIVHTADLE